MDCDQKINFEKQFAFGVYPQDPFVTRARIFEINSQGEVFQKLLF